MISNQHQQLNTIVKNNQTNILDVLKEKYKKITLVLNQIIN